MSLSNDDTRYSDEFDTLMLKEECCYSVTRRAICHGLRDGAVIAADERMIIATATDARCFAAIRPRYAVYAAFQIRRLRVDYACHATPLLLLYLMLLMIDAVDAKMPLSVQHKRREDVIIGMKGAIYAMRAYARYARAREPLLRCMNIMRRAMMKQRERFEPRLPPRYVTMITTARAVARDAARMPRARLVMPSLYSNASAQYLPLRMR